MSEKENFLSYLKKLFCFHDWKWEISKIYRPSGVRMGMVECIKCQKSKLYVAEVREVVNE